MHILSHFFTHFPNSNCSCHSFLQALPDFLTHVVEAELARVPLQVARRNMSAQQLWSVVYLPQVRPIRFVLICTTFCTSCASA